MLDPIRAYPGRTSGALLAALILPSFHRTFRRLRFGRR